MDTRRSATRRGRTAWRLFTVPLAFVAMLVALAAPASAASFPMERWDMTTCATDGAPSPVVHYANTAGMGYSIAFLIDGQSYTSVRLLPGTDSDYTSRRSCPART